MICDQWLEYQHIGIIALTLLNMFFTILVLREIKVNGK